MDSIVRGSLVQATGLSPYLGYQVTEKLVKEAQTSAAYRAYQACVVGH